MGSWNSPIWVINGHQGFLIQAGPAKGQDNDTIVIFKPQESSTDHDILIDRRSGRPGLYRRADPSLDATEKEVIREADWQEINLVIESPSHCL